MRRLTSIEARADDTAHLLFDRLPARGAGGDTDAGAIAKPGTPYFLKIVSIVVAPEAA